MDADCGLYLIDSLKLPISVAYDALIKFLCYDALTAVLKFYVLAIADINYYSHSLRQDFSL